MHPYANAIISSLEDPENILEQGVLDMNNDLIKVCQATTRACTQLMSRMTINKKVLEFLRHKDGT
ncbi:hypothetical protein JHK82_026446 [Glycine max]|nr:hypothetical protein JHK85_027059 [Glycine max]KAG5135258.1 hypothetical protein JHK82_026446 [Glycine max]